MITQKINDGQFAEDDELELLVSTLDESALQMRADHPEVASASEARIKQTLQEISDAKRLEIATRIDAMVEGTAHRLGNEFELAAETTRTAGSPEAQASAIKMSGERAGKISMAERAKKAESSGAMSAAKIALRARSLVEIVLGALSGGG